MSWTRHYNIIPSIKLTRERPLGLQRGKEQLGFRQDDHPTLSSKLEVGDRASDPDLAEQLSGRVEHMHAVAAARVQVALGVDVDAIRHAGRDEGESLAVGEGAVLFDIIAVTLCEMPC